MDQKIELETASNTQKAWEIVANQDTRPAVVFLDLAVPKDSSARPDVAAGFGLLEKIKQDPVLKKIKIIIFSGFPDLKYKEEAKSYGADGYLVKDESMPQDLVEFMERMIK
jgi:CheY-like chemotaxis protein